MEELKKVYLEEIKSLIEEFKKNKELPEVYAWNDTRNNENVEHKEYTNDLEGELLQEIDETKDPKVRKNLIEKLKQSREIRQEKIQQEVYEKSKNFQNNAKEKLEKELEDKQKELEELKETRKNLRKEKNKYLKIKKDFDKKSEIYKVADKESKELLKKLVKTSKEERKLIEEINEIDSKINSVANLYTEEFFSKGDDITKEVFKKIIDELEEEKRKTIEIEKEEAKKSETEKVEEVETKVAKQEKEEVLEEKVIEQEKEEQIKTETKDSKTTIKMVAARILKNDYKVAKGSVIYNKVMDALDSGIEIESVDEFIRDELVTMLRDNEDGKNNEAIEKLKKEMNKAGIKYNDIKEIIEERKRNLEEEQKRKKEEIEKNKLEAAKVLEEKYGIKKGDILYDKIMEIINFDIEVSDISEVARTEFTTMLNTNKNGRYDKDIEKLQKEMDKAGIKYDDIIAEAIAQKVAEEAEANEKAAKMAQLDEEIAEAKEKVAKIAELHKKIAEAKLQKEVEEEAKRKEQLKEARRQKPVKVIYSAKTDQYLLIDDVTNTTIVKSRKELEILDKEEFQELWNKNLTNVDMYCSQMLHMLDKDLAKDYINSLSEIGKNKEERAIQMRKLGLKINYVLKGIYDKDEKGNQKYSETEREEILEMANSSSKKGIATVEKGIKVKFLELCDRFNPKKLFSGIKLLEEGKDDIIREDKLARKMKEKEEAKEKKMKEKEERKAKRMKKQEEKKLKIFKDERPLSEQVKAEINEKKAAEEAAKKAQEQKDEQDKDFEIIG